MSARDIAAAQEMGCTVKLLAICERVTGQDGREGISARVHPALIPLSHPLASVREAYNAVFVEAEGAGELMFYGQGAGGDPTASAVLGDIVAVARTRVTGGRGPGESAYADLPVLSIGQAITRYHVSLDVADKPGVLASVATVFATQGVSIETVRQQVVTDLDPVVLGRLDEQGSPAATRDRELLEELARPLAGQPQQVTRRGKPAVVVLAACAGAQVHDRAGRRRATPHARQDPRRYT